MLAVDLTERHEVLAEPVLELSDVEAEVLEGNGALTNCICDGPGLWQQRDVEVTALGTDLEVLLEVPGASSVAS